jgi:hypothetical protein
VVPIYFREKQPRLVYFVLNVTDRDVPLDVDIFQLGKDPGRSAGCGSIYRRRVCLPGRSDPELSRPLQVPHRILQPGQEYYVRVAANHPAINCIPIGIPRSAYTDPHLAVRAGMDFLVNMGDSPGSPTRRAGSNRLAHTMQHSETQLCIACHPAQFTTRGYLRAVQNGYAPTQRAGLEFLTDRIYNNAGRSTEKPNTNWVRVIYTRAPKPAACR